MVYKNDKIKSIRVYYLKVRINLLYFNLFETIFPKTIDNALFDCNDYQIPITT